MLEFVSKTKSITFSSGIGDVVLTLHGDGSKRTPYCMGVILSKSGLQKLGSPEWLTVAVAKEKDHTRCYFKASDKLEGFHGNDKNDRRYFTVPRIDVKIIKELVGEHDLKFSKTYGFYYVEKETLNFVERQREK